MNGDKNTNIAELKERLLKFREDRDWAQYHNPKDLAEAIVIEAGELLELFLWKKPEVINTEIKDGHIKKKMEKELADIVIFCLNFANATGIDVAKAVIEKIGENDRKYPVKKAKGTAEKYDKL